MNRESMLTAAEAVGGYGAFNLGELMGLHWIASVVPLMAMWGVAGVVWARLRRQKISESSTSTG
jgi:hypothetical protein